MKLKEISILGYKNLTQVDLTLSPKINCFIGLNGMGKTNLLDAVHYLSFCKSASAHVDVHNIKRGADFFMLKGSYQHDDGTEFTIYGALKAQQKKVFKRNNKEYGRLSEHIGSVPLIMVSPADTDLINGDKEGRRRFMDMVISQTDRTYLQTLIRYQRALEQRNALLKSEGNIAEDQYIIWEEVMHDAGTFIHTRRADFIQQLAPLFQEFYARISDEKECVQLHYVSTLTAHSLRELLAHNRERDKILGYTTAGIHTDNVLMHLEGNPIKGEGSQGQIKTFLVALKLAQFDFVKRANQGVVPLLLLDDIFDKLDALRVEQIMKLVNSERFGQIFITDTNSANIDQMLERCQLSYALFEVQDGEVTLMRKRTPQTL